jgi:mRNA interferase MazF
MDKFQQGDIVWVNYPFSDQPQTSKKRPAVIVSNEQSNNLDNDCLICPITSSLRYDFFCIELGNFDVTNPLPVKSEVRANKVTTIRSSLIISKMSSLKAVTLEKLIQRIKDCFDSSNR